MPARLRVLMAAAALALLAFAPRAWAAPGVSISMISSPSLTLDSNKPCQEGPQAAYVAFRVTNTSGAALTDLRATLGGFASGIQLGGTSALTPQAATQYVGRMAAGATRTLYWYLEYPCNTFGNAANLVVTMTDATPGSTSSGATAGRVTTTSMVSAQAGGVLQSGTLGAGAVVGQTITFDVAYEFGGVSAGDSYNFQVAGNRNFNARCFQLLKMEVMSSQVPGATAGQTDNPFFQAPGNQGGSKIPITMRYYFKYLCANTTTTSRPYANQFSGGQLKYSSNYESFVGPTLPGATNPFVVTKTASTPVLAAGGLVTFRVTVRNPSPYAAEIDSIVDVLPPGVTYQGLVAPTNVDPATAGSVPATGSTLRIVWRGIPGSTFAVAANDSFTVRYQAQIPAAQAQYTNTAGGYTGVEQLGSNASATVTVGTANLSVTKTGPAQVIPGDSARYLIRVTNAGPLAATNVVVTDTIPVGAAFLRATGGATVAGRVVTWPAIASLAVDAIRTDTVVLLVPATAGSIANVAGVAALTPDTLSGNNRSTAQSVVGLADLSVAKTAVATTVAGDTLRYVLTTSNGGPTPALEVVLTDTLPAGVTFVRATRSPARAGQVLTWPAIASLAANTSQVDTVVAVAPMMVTSITNIAAGTTTTLDTVPGNNNGTAAASRASTTLTPAVAVTPDGNPTSRLQGGAYSQEFTVKSLSPTDGVYRLSTWVTAAGPGGVFVAVDSVKGAGIGSAAAYTSASIALPGRAEQVYTVYFRVDTGAIALNTKFLRAQAVSDTLLRDDGFAEVSRVRPTITLTKSVSPQGTVATGTDLTYTMSVSNVGGFAARGVTVTDSVPDRVDFKLNSVSLTLPSGLTATVEYLNAQKAPITPGVTACPQTSPAGYDRCVRWVSWKVTGDLPPGASVSAGQFRFVARIR